MFYMNCNFLEIVVFPPTSFIILSAWNSCWKIVLDETLSVLKTCRALIVHCQRTSDFFLRLYTILYTNNIYMCWAELSECEKFQYKRLLHSRIPLHAWLADNVNYCNECAKQLSAMQTSYMLEASLIRTISPIQGFCPMVLFLQDSSPADNDLTRLLLLGGSQTSMCMYAWWNSSTHSDSWQAH